MRSSKNKKGVIPSILRESLRRTRHYSELGKKAQLTQRTKVRVAHDNVVVTNLCRNRSFDAFQLDPEANLVLKENADLPFVVTRPEYASDAYRAVDPRLRLIYLRDSLGEIIGIVGFVALHPTAMSHETVRRTGGTPHVPSFPGERHREHEQRGAKPYEVYSAV